MPSLNRMVAAGVVLATIFLSSCCTTTPCTLKPNDRRSWVLTCIELDRCNLQNTGSLPVYRKSDGYSFGQEPVALGTMQASRDGLWSISVKFRETVVAFAGRTGVHEYDALTLAGKACPDGKRIMAQGAIPADVMVGVATEVWLQRVSDTKFKVQPATRGKRLPYIFTFDACPVQARPVTIPLL